MHKILVISLQLDMKSESRVGIFLAQSKTLEITRRIASLRPKNYTVIKTYTCYHKSYDRKVHRIYNHLVFKKTNKHKVSKTYSHLVFKKKHTALLITNHLNIRSDNKGTRRDTVSPRSQNVSCLLTE